MAAIGNAPLIAIVGPTASGKTSVALRIAETINGEIICADSRTIYKGMDIGTAKPTAAEQSRVVHWGIDLIEPGQQYSVSEFQKYARQKITDIRARGKVPLLVGGTGLYVDSVLFDFTFSMAAKKEWRNQLTTDAYIVGIATERSVLRKRIKDRAEQLFENGVVEEATKLGEKYGWDAAGMTGNVYQIVHAYLKNEESLSNTVDKYTTVDWQLAKRQMTWFRPNPHIEWCKLDDAYRYGIKLASE